MAISAAMLTNIAVAYAYVAAWIGASAGVILYNKCVHCLIIEALSEFCHSPRTSQMDFDCLGVRLSYHTHNMAHGFLLSAVVRSGASSQSTLFKQTPVCPCARLSLGGRMTNAHSVVFMVGPKRHGVRSKHQQTNIREQRRAYW